MSAAAVSSLSIAPRLSTMKIFSPPTSNWIPKSAPSTLTILAIRSRLLSNSVCNMANFVSSMRAFRATTSTSSWVRMSESVSEAKPYE